MQKQARKVGFPIAHQFTTNTKGEKVPLTARLALELVRGVNSAFSFCPTPHIVLMITSDF